MIKPSRPRESIGFLNKISKTFITVIESNFKYCLRTFAPIATVHPYSARKFTCHVMHRARALSTKINNDREDGHC